MTFTSTARQVDEGLRHEVDVNGRHLLITDEPDALGGTDSGPAPHELLPAMVAACVSTMVAMYARSRGWEIGEVAVDVEYDPETTPRRCEITLRLPGRLSAEQRRRLLRVVETCPVRRALEAGFEFEERIVESVDDPRAAALVA